MSNGDGWQASHWKDNRAGFSPIGIMDPSVAYGVMNATTSLDLAAFDVMGWTMRYDVLARPDLKFDSAYAYHISFVPEPETWAMLIVGFAMVGVGLRRKRAATS